MYELKGVLGATLSKVWLATDASSNELKEGKKFAAMLAKERHLFAASLSCESVPKLFYLVAENNRATGAVKHWYLVMGVSAPINLQSVFDAIEYEDARINAVPLGIFGRDDDLMVRIVKSGRPVDCTSTDDIPMVSFTHKQWPDLKMRPVSGLEELVALLGESFCGPSLTALLLKWKPLTALKELQAWGPSNNVVAFMDKMANSPRPAPFTSLSSVGRAIALQMGISYAFKHKIENALADKAETKGKVAGRLIDYASTTVAVVEFVKAEPELFASTKPSATAAAQLIKDLDGMKPTGLLTAKARSMIDDAKEGVLSASARNAAEASHEGGKRKGTHASPGVRRSLRSREDEGNEGNEGNENPQKPKVKGSKAVKDVDMGIEEGSASKAKPRDLASLMAAASAPAEPPKASENSTLLAMHAAQSTAFKEMEAELQTERLDHRRTFETLAKTQAELAAKTAQLEANREAMAEFHKLRTTLEEKEGAMRAGQAEAKEKAIRIKELKKEKKQNQAILLAMSTVNHGAVGQFLALSPDSDDDM